MLKFRLLFLFTLALSINTQAQFGKIHHIIEYNKNGDTLACYEYNKKGLIKRMKLYRKNENYRVPDYKQKTHLAYEYIYNDSNEFSLLTKEISYGFIEEYPFCNCNDPFCDTCDQTEIMLNISYIKDITEYFFSSTLQLKYSKTSWYDSGYYIFQNCYSDSCLKLFKIRNLIINKQQYDINSYMYYDINNFLTNSIFMKVLRRGDTVLFSKNELYYLRIWKICDCPKNNNIYDTILSGEFNFYKDSIGYYASSDKFEKILLNEKMPCCNNKSKYNQLTFYKYTSEKTENGFNIRIFTRINDQIPQKDLIKKIRENKNSRLKIKRY